MRTLRVDGANAIGMRLGMCKYGYNNAFCIRVHMDGSLVTCRAFNIHDPLRRRGIEQEVLTEVSQISSQRWPARSATSAPRTAQHINSRMAPSARHRRPM